MTQFKDLLGGSRFTKADGLTYVKLSEENMVSGTLEAEARIVNAYLERLGEAPDRDDYVFVNAEALVTPLPDTPMRQSRSADASIVSLDKFRKKRRRST